MCVPAVSTPIICQCPSTSRRLLVKLFVYVCSAVTGYGRAFYVSSVWAAMTWKWSFLLFLYARNYRRLYERRSGMCADVGYQKI